MTWPEVSIEDFPPERDDEPASLRQDILDELTDHFACALNRELLKNPDERLARQSVVNQFGDPIKIARQLWFDEMKEKIMSQRIMTGVSLVMSVCCIAVVGLTWVLIKESQGVNQSMLAQLAVIADRPQTNSKVVQSLQHTNETIASELKSISERQQSKRPAGVGLVSETDSNSVEMNQVSFQLVQDNKAKKPAVGFTGKLTKSGNQTDRFTVEAVSNESGKLDFGKLPWGRYKLNLRAPWAEYFSPPSLTVIPGRGYSQTIVCPAAAPARVPVQFQVNWSDKLKSEDWILLCDFREIDPAFGGDVDDYTFDSFRQVDDNNWESPRMPLRISTGVYFINSNNQVSVCPLKEYGEFKDLDPDVLVEKPSINIVEGGDYYLSVIYLIQKKDLKKLSVLNSPKSYKVFLDHDKGLIESGKARIALLDPSDNRSQIASHSVGIGGSSISLGQSSRFVEDPVNPFTSILLPFKKVAFVPDDNESVLSELPSLTKNINGILLPQRLTYSASKDSPNVWKIKLPDLNSIIVKSDLEKKTK